MVILYIHTYIHIYIIFYMIVAYYSVPNLSMRAKILFPKHV